MELHVTQNAGSGLAEGDRNHGRTPGKHHVREKNKAPNSSVEHVSFEIVHQSTLELTSFVLQAEFG